MITLFCLPEHVEAAKRLLAKTDNEPVGMGVAVVKPEGGALIGGVTFYPITEEQFLLSMADRRGVTIQREKKGIKHYFFDGAHFASKIKKQYVVVHSVYKELTQ